MHLDRASAYGIVATAFLANEHGAGPVAGRRIAERHTIPPDYLLKILQQLVRAGVLRGARGRHGGFVLKHPPELTTLLDVIEAISGPLEGELVVRDEIQGADGVKDRLDAECREIARYARSRLRRINFSQLVHAP